MTAINPLLRMEKVEVLYQKMITAIHGVSLVVFPGQITALLGANGAGKTTTLRAVTGFLGSDDAEVSEGRIGSMARPSRTGNRTKSPPGASRWFRNGTRSSDADRD